MTAILFGSISTVADTSELQRQAFHDAFAEHGLDWRWEPDEYRALLARSGGRDRIAAYAEARGEEVDAAAVHASKTAAFQRRLAAGGISARPGVAEVVAGARQRGISLGLVTTTSPGNVEALLAAVAAEVPPGSFEVVVDTASAAAPKPDPAPYLLALSRLGTDAGSAVAIEDNVDGVAAAVAAGLPCVGFPNANTAAHDLSPAPTVERLDLDELARTAGAAR